MNKWTTQAKLLRDILDNEYRREALETCIKRKAINHWDSVIIDRRPVVNVKKFFEPDHDVLLNNGVCIVYDRYCISLEYSQQLTETYAKLCDLLNINEAERQNTKVALLTNRKVVNFYGVATATDGQFLVDAENDFVPVVFAHEAIHVLLGNTPCKVAAEGAAVHFASKLFPADYYSINSLSRRVGSVVVEVAARNNGMGLSPEDMLESARNAGLTPTPDEEINAHYIFSGLFAIFLEGRYGNGTLLKFYKATQSQSQGYLTERRRVELGLLGIGLEPQEVEAEFNEIMNKYGVSWLQYQIARGAKK